MENSVEPVRANSLWRVYVGIARVLVAYAMAFGSIFLILSTFKVGQSVPSAMLILLVVGFFAVINLWPLLPLIAIRLLSRFSKLAASIFSALNEYIFVIIFVAWLISFHFQAKGLRRVGRAALNQPKGLGWWFYIIQFIVIFPLFFICSLVLIELVEACHKVRLFVGSELLYTFIALWIVGALCFALALLLTAGMAWWRSYELSSRRVALIISSCTLIVVCAACGTGVLLGWWPLLFSLPPVLTVLLLAGRLVCRTPLMAQIMYAGQPEADKAATLRYFL